MPTKKVNVLNYHEIKVYARNNGRSAACKKYGISRTTVSTVTQSADYTDYQKRAKAYSKAAYQMRRDRIKAKVENGPFDNATIPESIIPQDSDIKENKNGSVVTVGKVADSIVEPMTFDQYKQAYLEYKEKYEKVDGQLADLKKVADLYQKQRDEEIKLKKEYQDELRNAQSHISELERSVENYKVLLETANKEQANVASPTTPSHTKIEITVGSAHIVVSDDSPASVVATKEGL